MKKLLPILLCLPLFIFCSEILPKKNDLTRNNLNDTISSIYQTQLPELECNICDSIILVNPDKQQVKPGVFILDFRKTRDKDNYWKYTYGNNSGNFYDRNFLPDTLVGCVWSKTVESKKCCSKWAWDGLSWKKQKPVTFNQAKSYIESPKPKAEEFGIEPFEH